MSASNVQVWDVPVLGLSCACRHARMRDTWPCLPYNYNEYNYRIWPESIKAHDQLRYIYSCIYNIPARPLVLHVHAPREQLYIHMYTHKMHTHTRTHMHALERTDQLIYVIEYNIIILYIELERRLP